MTMDTKILTGLPVLEHLLKMTEWKMYWSWKIILIFI